MPSLTGEFSKHPLVEGARFFYAVTYTWLRVNYMDAACVPGRVFHSQKICVAINPRWFTQA